MLDVETVSCPVCDTELHVKVNRFGKKPVYIVSEDCSNCKTPAEKIEKFLNGTGKRGYTKTEKSYIKLSPRG